MNHDHMDTVLHVLSTESCIFCKCRLAMQNFSILSITMRSHILTTCNIRPTRKPEENFSQGRVVIGQEVMALNWKRVDFD